MGSQGLLNWAPGMHAIITHNGKRRCSVCLRSGSEMGVSGCEYSVIALGHRLWSLDTVIFCIRCGANSDGRVGKLDSICSGKPDTTYLKLVRRRLTLGRHPRSNMQVGVPEPFTVQGPTLDGLITNHVTEPEIEDEDSAV